jgi:hypothetical protein
MVGAMLFVADKCDNCNFSYVQSILFLWWRQCARHDEQTKYQRDQDERAKVSAYPWRAAPYTSRTMMPQWQREREQRDSHDE